MPPQYEILKIANDDVNLINPNAGSGNRNTNNVENLRAYYAALYKRLLFNAKLGTKETPTNICLKSVLTGGLNALEVTDPQFTLPVSNNASSSTNSNKKNLSLDVTPLTTPNARKKGIRFDQAWLNNNHKMLADIMIEEVGKQFPDTLAEQIQIVIKDWTGKDYFSSPPLAKPYGTGDVLITVTFAAQGCQYFWQQNPEQFAYQLGKLAAYFEAGLEATKKTLGNDDESLQKILDQDETQKLKSLNKNIDHYELALPILLYENADYKKIFEIFNDLPYTDFERGFNETKPREQDAINVFNNISAAGAAYFLGQPKLIDNLKKSPNPSDTKQAVSAALVKTFSESRMHILVKSVCFTEIARKGGALLSPQPRDKIQSNIASAVAIVSQLQLSFPVSFQRSSFPSAGQSNTEQFKTFFNLAIIEVCQPDGFYNVYLALEMLKRLISLYAVLLALLHISKITHVKDQNEYQELDRFFCENISSIAQTIYQHLAHENTAQKEMANRIYNTVNKYLQEGQSSKTFIEVEEKQKWFTQVETLANLEAKDLKKTDVSQAKEPDDQQMRNYAINILKAFELLLSSTITHPSIVSLQSLQATSFIAKNTIVTSGRKAYGIEERADQDVGTSAAGSKISTGMLKK